jgi:hypothetical protein
LNDATIAKLPRSNPFQIQIGSSKNCERHFSNRNKRSIHIGFPGDAIRGRFCSTRRETSSGWLQLQQRAFEAQLEHEKSGYAKIMGGKFEDRLRNAKLELERQRGHFEQTPE